MNKYYVRNMPIFCLLLFSTAVSDPFKCEWWPLDHVYEIIVSIRPAMLVKTGHAEQNELCHTTDHTHTQKLLLLSAVSRLSIIPINKWFKGFKMRTNHWYDQWTL